MFNKMVGISENEDRTQCYIKKVGDTDFIDDEGKIKNRDVHLAFKSKRDYNKIIVIEEMFKKYFVLEEKFLKTEEKFVIYYYLKEIIRKLKEYEVMEILSDQTNAFKSEVRYIGDFINNRMKLKLPQSPDSLIVIYDVSDYEDLEKVERENEKYFRNIRKVLKLLKEKILFE